MKSQSSRRSPWLQDLLRAVSGQRPPQSNPQAPQRRKLPRIADILANTGRQTSDTP